jgi:hypothetical protein
MSPKRILGLAIAASTLVSFAAPAATGTPERVRGAIASATAHSVTVDTYANKPVTMVLSQIFVWQGLGVGSTATASGG